MLCLKRVPFLPVVLLVIDMRYIVQSTFADEVPYRRAYLYDALQLWFMVTKDECNNYVLKSIPSTSYDSLVIIVGDNYFVKEFLCNNTISEKLIVAITCDRGCNFRKVKLSGKNLYLPHLDKDGYAELLKGSNYEFGFDPTESEVLLYNAPKTWSLEERITYCFTKYY